MMHCRVCDATHFSTVIDLKDQPWGNHFLKDDEKGQEPFYPLRVVYCKNCQTAQLDYTVKKEVMFADHTYLSGMTASLKNHFKETATLADAHFFKERSEKSALDIGSNDGSQLACYKELGYKILGVESSQRIAAMANENGITTVHAFFNEELTKGLPDKFDLINASGVFFHLEELHSVTAGIRLLLKEDGLFVVQFLYMKSIMENVAFDQIYHEHLLYYTLQTIQRLLGQHKLELFDAYLSPIHGGSIIGYVSHEGRRPKTKRLLDLIAEEEISKTNEEASYRAFAEAIERMKTKNVADLLARKKEGKRIFGMGAPVKGNTLLNYFGIGRETLDCLVEKNPLRKGLFSPGRHIPIALEGELNSHPDVYYVLAWNFKKEILAKYQHLVDQGVEFYFPVEPK